MASEGGHEKGRRRLPPNALPSPSGSVLVGKLLALALLPRFARTGAASRRFLSQGGEGVGGSASRVGGKPFPRSEIEVWRWLLLTKEKGGGGGRLGHFSPSGGRVRDDVACPVRCPIMRIITGTCTGTAQTPNPGIKCGYTPHRAVQEFRKTNTS